MGREDHDKGSGPPRKPRPIKEPYLPGKSRFEPPAGLVGLAAAKAALRAELLAGRRARPPDQRTAAGQALRDAVLSAPETQMAGTVAAYYSVGTEPDTRGLVFALWKRGTYVLLPLLRPDGDLDWASHEGPDSLVRGRRGLWEPREAGRGVEAIAR